MKRITVIAALLILAGVVQSRATLLVRELWDNVTNGTPEATGVSSAAYPLAGQGNGTTTYGFLGQWVLNATDPALTNGVLQVSASDDSRDDYTGLYGYLPENWTASGVMCLNAPNTNGWDSGTWATRLLATTSWIKPNSISTNYFSFRWVKRSFYYSVDGTNGYGADDAGLGVGFSSGAASSSAFIGIGITRSVAQYTYTGTGYTNLAGTADIGDTPYITAGTLGQAGYPGHPGDSGGPYYVQAYAGDGSGSGVINQCEGYLSSSGFPISTNANYMWGGCLVGQIITSTGGNVEIDVKNYSGTDPGAPAIDNLSPSDPGYAGLYGWDSVYHTTTSAVNLNYLLVWMYGNNNANPCYIDSIRVASTWSEVLGQEAETPTITPSNPTNTFFQGTALALNDTAAIDATTNGWYEWLYSSNATLGATAVGIGSNSFSLPNPQVSDSGYYNVVFSNGWESGSTLLVTSPPVHLTIVAPAKPSFVLQPQPAGRYSTPGAASATMTAAIVGTPPFYYWWCQATGGVTNVVSTTGSTNGVTNSITFTAPILPSAAGNYFVIASNYLGATTSSIASFTVIVPTPGSYAAQVLSNNPWAYWRLDENYGTTNLHDYYGGNDGSILDPTNTVTIGTNAPIIGGVFQDQPAAPYAGFPANHVGLYIPLVYPFPLARVNLPGVGNYQPGMTWMCWLYAPNPNSNPTAESGCIMWNRDYSGTTDGASGYGNAFGIDFYQYVVGGVTNNNELGYRWGGGAENPSAPYYGYDWPSGLYAPTNGWYFVAMVWGAANSATIYMGTNTGPLTVASTTLPAAFDPTYPGTSYSNSYSILLGRNGYPWSETQGSAEDQANVSMSDVAIFNSALSSNAISQIYFAAMGELITYTNSAGNLVLSWPEGTLMSSTNVAGPYSAVIGASPPSYTVSKTTPKQFYRVKR